MSVNRIPWATSNGGTVEQVLLIAGVPGVFVQPGSALTTVSWTGDADAAWWTGTALTSPHDYRKPWLDARDLAIDFRARPVDGSVQVSPVTRKLFDNGIAGSPTAMLGSRSALASSALTASLTATDTTVHVQSTAAFGTVGTTGVLIFVGRETMVATIATSTTFTVTRGAFGSLAKIHLGSSSPSSPAARAYNGVQSLVNRRATLWFVRQSPGDPTTGIDPTLVFDGKVSFGGGAEGASWRISMVSTLAAPAEKPRTPSLLISGYAHPGYHGYYGSGLIPHGDVPLACNWQGITILLSDTSSAYDRGGWHPDAQSFIAAFNTAAASWYAGAGGDMLQVRLQGDGSLNVTGSSGGGGSVLYVYGGWLDGGFDATPTGGDTNTTPWKNYGNFPTAYQTLSGTAWFNAADIAQVPIGTGAWTAEVGVSATFVWYTLNATVGGKMVTAKITDKEVTSSGGTLGLLPTVSSTPLSNVLVLQPTQATLGAYVVSDSWISAARYLASTVGGIDGFDIVDDSYDWSRISTVTQRGGSPWPQDRAYAVDLAATSYLDILRNEIRLNGMIVAPYRGRIACARISDVGTNVTADFTIYATMLRKGEVPTVQEVSDGLLTAFTVKLPDGTPVTFQDRIAADEAGAGGEVKCTFYGNGAFSGYVPLNPLDAAWQQQFASFAVNAIGPWRQSYRVVKVPLTLAAADVQIGDVIRFGDGNNNPGDYFLPNDKGGRGLNGAVGQVIGYALRFGGGQSDGVDLDVRLSASGVAGYAPECLVDLNGITAGSGDIAVDLTTWGTYGFADPSGLADGGASQFAVGDYVELMELDNASPATPFQCKVTGISGTTITVNPAPTMAWQTLATSRLKVLLAYRGDYNTCTASQKAWLWIGDHTTGLLGGTDVADVWAP